MIRAGESVGDIDRISCFFGAVMGFSSVIFMPKDGGWRELREACQQVWENIERDKSIRDKWVCCSSYNLG